MCAERKVKMTAYLSLIKLLKIVKKKYDVFPFDNENMTHLQIAQVKENDIGSYTRRRKNTQYLASYIACNLISWQFAVYFIPIDSIMNFSF
jgi:hypothetical protein